MSDLDNFTPEPTADGSFTFFSKEFGESFHSHYGAKQESFFKFVEPTQLALRASHKPILRLLDVCYGLGYNTAAALQTIWSVNPNCYVEVIGLELNASVPQAAIAHKLFDNWNYEYTQIVTQLAQEQQIQTNRLQAKLLIGDARTTIQQVYHSGFRADAIFLDPFSPPQCPQLWTVEFIQLVAMCLHVEGLLATYSCAAAVRTALLAAGLQIGSTPPVGRRSPGTVAAQGDKGHRASGKGQGASGMGKKTNNAQFPIPNAQCPIPNAQFPMPNAQCPMPNAQCPMPDAQCPFPLPPLSEAEKEHLLTRAAIPYRDPELKDPSHVIIKRREQEQQASSVEPTSHWRKRWLSKSH